MRLKLFFLVDLLTQPVQFAVDLEPASFAPSVSNKCVDSCRKMLGNPQEQKAQWTKQEGHEIWRRKLLSCPHSISPSNTSLEVQF